MFSSDIPDDWTPPDPPEIGTKAWLDEMAFRFMADSFGGLPDESGVFELPRVTVAGQSYEMGYFVLFSDSYGKNYFRVDEIQKPQVKPTYDD